MKVTRPDVPRLAERFHDDDDDDDVAVVVAVNDRAELISSAHVRAEVSRRPNMSRVFPLPAPNSESSFHFRSRHLLERAGKGQSDPSSG